MDQEKSQKFRVGIDIGGTFTDIIFIGDDGTVYTKKTLSTPGDYSQGIITGTEEVIQEHGLNAYYSDIGFPAAEVKAKFLRKTKT